ncbi:MAG: hypothetical protein OJF58_004209 [Enhydrobacter sp.]|jgi:hypothetical protein|nr:MAG: hypothetical protein OJF58_004209 [Enhydrobacter sp.]
MVRAGATIVVAGRGFGEECGRGRRAAEWHTVLDSNLTSVFLCSHAA